MKKAFMIMAVMALALFAPAVPSSSDILTPDSPTLRGQNNDYYISIHKPDGSCETVEVIAPSLSEAFSVVKEKRCDFCTLWDVTDTMKSGIKDEIVQTTKLCPVY